MIKSIFIVIFHCDKSEDIKDLATVIPTIVREGQTAVIDYSDFKDEDLNKYIPLLIKLQQDIDIKLLIHLYHIEPSTLDRLKHYNVKYMFFPYAYNKETFFEQKELGASDIYVVEELGFSLIDIVSDVTIRVFPDVAQCGLVMDSLIPAIKKFWIRPENLEDTFADVCEFYHSGDSLNVIYEVYKQGQWLGDLNDIIADLGESIPNTGITPVFGDIRSKCHHKCMLGNCDYCDQVKATCDMFKKAGLEIRQKRKKPEISENRKEQLTKMLEQEKDKE